MQDRSNYFCKKSKEKEISKYKTEVITSVRKVKIEGGEREISRCETEVIASARKAKIQIGEREISN